MRNQYSLLRPPWFGPLTATGHCKKCNANKYFSFCVPLQKDTSWWGENDIFILWWTLTLMSSNMLTVGCRESLTVILHFYECWIKHRNSGITVHALKVSRVPVTLTFHKTITKLLFLLFCSFYFFPYDSQMFGCWDWEEETGSDCEKEITDAGEPKKWNTYIGHYRGARTVLNVRDVLASKELNYVIMTRLQWRLASIIAWRS